MNRIANGMASALRQTIDAPEVQGRVLTVAVSTTSMGVAGTIADAWRVRV
jgi:hypothetical protein